MLLSLVLLFACGGSGSESPTVIVNKAPIIDEISTQSFDEQADYTITANANDSDGQITTYA